MPIRKKTIWHVGAFNDTNYGDVALQVSIRELLLKRGDFDIVPINAQTTYFSEDLIEKLNQEADLLIVGGGGLIFHRPQDNSRSGWQFNILTENIAKIKIPVVVLSIGYNKFPNDQHQFSKETWNNIGTLLNHATLKSVRNQGTFDEVMRNVGINELEIVPDAGMLIDLNNKAYPKLTSRNNIGINWATDRPEQRFGSIDEYEKILQNTLKTLKSVLPNATFYIFEHLKENNLNVDGKKILYENVEKLMPDAVFIKRVYSNYYPPDQKYLSDFVGLYSQMQLVIGMRGHANIIPFGQSVPVIGIGSHQKVKFFLEDVGMEEYYVSLNNNALATTINKVYDNYNKHTLFIKSELKKCHMQIEKYFDRIVDILE